MPDRRSVYPLIATSDEIEEILLEQAHAQCVVILPIAEKFLDQFRLVSETAFLVHVNGRRVRFVDDQIKLAQVQYGKRIVDREPRGDGRVAAALRLRSDDNLELAAPVDVVEFDQLDQTDGFAGVVDRDEAALALVVNVLIVKLRQLREGLIRLLEPVTHDFRVVIEGVDEAKIVAFQRPQGQSVTAFVCHGFPLCKLLILADVSPRDRRAPVSASAWAVCSERQSGTDDAEPVPVAGSARWWLTDLSARRRAALAVVRCRFAAGSISG